MNQDQVEEALILLREIRDLLAKKKKNRVASTDAGEVWDSYEKNFVAKWKVKPERNAKVNNMLKAFRERVPKESWHSLIAFYFRQNDYQYTKSYHSASLLLRDCEILLTRMRSGTVITDSKAREIERMSDNLNISNQYLKDKYAKRTE